VRPARRARRVQQQLQVRPPFDGRQAERHALGVAVHQHQQRVADDPVPLLVRRGDRVAPQQQEPERALESALPVRVDRDQLTQVLVNLVKNAEEAMPGGGRIVVRTRRAGGAAHLEVEDTGPGVPPEHRMKILEPYFTTKAGGTGLGLAIASRICQEHGGALEVDGAPGQGALFRVVLPLDAGAPKS
jgi:signal transduction histidine kinase